MNKCLYIRANTRLLSSDCLPRCLPPSESLSLKTERGNPPTSSFLPLFPPPHHTCRAAPPLSFPLLLRFLLMLQRVLIWSPPFPTALLWFHIFPISLSQSTKLLTCSPPVTQLTLSWQSPYLHHMIHRSSDQTPPTPSTLRFDGACRP